MGRKRQIKEHKKSDKPMGKHCIFFVLLFFLYGREKFHGFADAYAVALTVDWS